MKGKTRKASRPRRKTMKQLAKRRRLLRAKGTRLARKSIKLFSDRTKSDRAVQASGRAYRATHAISRKLAKAAKPRKAKRAKRPMSAANREAFKRRMAEARARKHGNRPSEPTRAYGSAAGAPTRRSGAEPTARRVKRASSPGAAGRIVELLKAHGWQAKLYVRPDVNEIVTDAPPEVCAEAARAAGA